MEYSDCLPTQYHMLRIYTVCREVINYFPPELIDIGFEAPAGQMYASTNDLAQLMKLLFRPDEPYDPDKGQV